MSISLPDIKNTQNNGCILDENSFIPSQIKWKGSSLQDSSIEIRILTVTWNMHGLSCPEDICDILLPEVLHHIYIISTQECLKPMWLSIFSPSKREWERKVLSTLGKNYYLATSESLGNVHLMIAVHISLLDIISQPKIDTVSTGILNIIPNKGGIGASFSLKDKTFLIIACHLTSGEKNKNNRNEDLKRIEKGLLLGTSSKFNLPASSRFDCTILCGDLNYRINTKGNIVRYWIKQQERWMLMKYDELLGAMREGEIAVGFIEGEIGFPPTYKLKKNVYDKERVPSWTDRILYKDKLKIMTQETYGSIISNLYSDHKPVYSQFSIKL